MNKAINYIPGTPDTLDTKLKPLTKQKMMKKPWNGRKQATNDGINDENASKDDEGKNVVLMRQKEVFNARKPMDKIVEEKIIDDWKEIFDDGKEICNDEITSRDDGKEVKQRK